VTKNVVLITTDQHRWDYLGARRQPILQGLTPNLDRLVQEGALFDHCYSPNPLCMPARHAMQTGLYTFQSGQMNNVGDWPLDFPTFPQVLRRHGYRTALTGKLHAHEAVGYDIDLTDKVWDDEIHALGFDDVVQTAGKSMAFFTEDAYTHYLADHGLLYAYREDIVKRQEASESGAPTAWPSILPEEHYVDNFIGQHAVDWLRAYDDEAPFLHVVSFCSPHPPFDAPQRAVDAVDPDRAVLPADAAAPERLRAAIVNYAAQIHAVDENIGKILDVLEARGWLNDTLILFTADHGEMLGDAGRWGKCGWLDSSVRVPLIARCPAWTGARRVTKTIVSCHDVAPTILDFALGPDIARDALPGSSAVSLKPFLTGAATAVRDLVYSENGGQFGRPWRMIDDGTYRYVWLLDTDEELLFGRAEDHLCQVNLAVSTSASLVLDRLRKEMLRIHVAHPTPKSGRAAYSPATDHRVTRDRLERTS
jgi:arylsulfatase